MTDKKEFFPQGLALGNNFCNRLDEQKRLLNNIQSTSATLIASPRRYGKTSLALNVLYKYKIPFAFIDLYAEIDEEGIANTILSGIGDVLYQLESAPQKAMKAVTDFFAGLSISFGFKGAQVKVGFSKVRKTPARLLLTTLKELDAILQRKKKKIVLFLDEFQRVSEVSESMAIEGALRNIAQQTRNISFIFSGSNRHLLNDMFNDRAKPFYNLCDKITLSRIEEKDYIPFIQKKAQKKWKKSLKKEAIEEIFVLTQRHPYYLNVLCHRLWYRKEPPTVSTTLHEWEQYTQEEKNKVMMELERLSVNQSKMIIAISKYGAKYRPSGRDFLALSKFSSSSAIQTLKKLQVLDYLYINKEGQYCLLDPVIEYLFAKE